MSTDDARARNARPPRPEPGERYEVTPQGSLGLLAAGYKGLRAWRKVRDQAAAARQKAAAEADDEAADDIATDASADSSADEPNASE